MTELPKLAEGGRWLKIVVPVYPGTTADDLVPLIREAVEKQLENKEN